MLTGNPCHKQVPYGLVQRRAPTSSHSSCPTLCFSAPTAAPRPCMGRWIVEPRSLCPAGVTRTPPATRPLLQPRRLAARGLPGGDGAPPYRWRRLPEIPRRSSGGAPTLRLLSCCRVVLLFLLLFPSRRHYSFNSPGLTVRLGRPHDASRIVARSVRKSQKPQNTSENQTVWEHALTAAGFVVTVAGLIVEVPAGGNFSRFLKAVTKITAVSYQAGEVTARAAGNILRQSCRKFYAKAAGKPDAIAAESDRPKAAGENSAISPGNADAMYSCRKR